MIMGRPYGNLKSKPPKRATSFIAQSIEHLMTLSQEFAGAVAFGDILVNYAWYIFKEYEKKDLYSDGLKKKIENDLQSFVHVANNNFRIGGDSPFSNVSLYCRITLNNMFENYYYPDGSQPMDIIDFIMRIQEIFMEFISKKDPLSGVPYRFPVITINLFIDKDNKKVLDSQFLDLVSEYNKEGCFNIFITSDKARIASCCRMINNKTDLMDYKGIDSFGNGGLNIGSHRVVTINMVRLARLSKTIDDFKYRLSIAMDDVVKILMAHRYLIKDRIDQGFLQFFNPHGWLNFDTMFFSTIGVNGIYEACQYLGCDILENQTQLIDILCYMDSEMNKLAGEYQIPINLEQIPGESAAINLAKKDGIFFDDQPHQLYANQFVPLWETDVNIVDRAIIDGKLSKYFGGGVISHLNIASAATKNQMKDLIMFASSTGLDHFALNPCFSVCEDGHTTITKYDVCPVCGKPIVTKYTRVVGYFTPVNDWVKERREFEFPKRRFNFLESEGDNIQELINNKI
jgi:ribonucleoside-triphosphate reductase